MRQAMRPMMINAPFLARLPTAPNSTEFAKVFSPYKTQTPRCVRTQQLSRGFTAVRHKSNRPVDIATSKQTPQSTLNHETPTPGFSGRI